MNKIQFQKSLASENLDHHLEFLLVLKNLLDRAVEAVERTVGDLHSLSDDERGDVLLILLELLVHYTEYPVDLGGSEGYGLLVLALSLREEAGYVGYVADDVLQLACQMGLDENVAGKEYAFLADLLTVAHLIDLLGGNENLGYVVIETECSYLALNVLLGLFLLTAGASDDVPFFSSSAIVLV